MTNWLAGLFRRSCRFICGGYSRIIRVMAIEWKKVTWYSKILAVALFIITFYVGYKLGIQKGQVEIQNANPDVVVALPKVKAVPITITTKNIDEKNFTGKMTVVAGPAASNLVIESNKYIKSTVASFKAQADKDVPDMREKFGADSPTANYTIEIEGTHIKGDKTESIVLSTYAYTGGANGNSTYKVFTASKDGKILSLSDVIGEYQEDAFAEHVRKQLTAWRPEESTGPVVFEEEVANLTFSSFTNWAIDGSNLVLYFDKYEIGPGVLGAVAFPLPLSSLKTFLSAGY